MADWLTSTQAAKLLGVHPGTLANWRYYGRGPKYDQKGRSVRYRRDELERYKRDNVVYTVRSAASAQ